MILFESEGEYLYQVIIYDEHCFLFSNVNAKWPKLS